MHAPQGRVLFFGYNYRSCCQLGQPLMGCVLTIITDTGITVKMGVDLAAGTLVTMLPNATFMEMFW